MSPICSAFVCVCICTASCVFLRAEIPCLVYQHIFAAVCMCVCFNSHVSFIYCVACMFLFHVCILWCMCMCLCVFVCVRPIVHACKKKENGCLFISVLDVCIVGTTFVSFLFRCQVWMPLPET